MGTFRPLEPLQGWRRLAVHSWRAPSDPTVYALVDVPMAGALAYLESLRAETDVRITVTHLVAKGVALAISEFPQLNGIVAGGRIMLRDSVDIFLQVATGGGQDLAGVKIAQADRKSVVDIAQEASERIRDLRNGRDENVERTKSMLQRIPRRLLGPMMRLVAYLIYDLDLDLTRFGVVKDEFGTAMVSNAGTFGVGVALAPLVPFSRTPMVVLVGELEDRVVVEDGEPVVRPMLTLGVTFDHRFMDGFHGGRMIRVFREYMADPAAAGDVVPSGEVAATLRSTR
jgi:pyruvate dehydrogenase E2 component (dihydrolipoamide acetyltransferase)